MKTIHRIACTLLLVWLCLSSISIVLPLDTRQINLSKLLSPPETHALLGYDELGRSILPRLIIGARNALLVTLSVVSLAFLFGTTIGIIGAWYGGYIDKITVMCMDLFLAFPGILLAITLAGLMGPSIGNTIMALSLISWVGFARLARAQTLSIKQRQHIEAAIALGRGKFKIALLHIFPLTLPPLIIEVTFSLSGIIIAEASLSFLGLGIQPPTASLGSMIREGTRYMLIAPHLVLSPGIAISLIVLSVNIMGDYLRDRLDKKGYTLAKAD